MENIVVELENMRLDTYLASKYKDLSRAMVKKLIEQENILVNGKAKKISYKVQKGDIVEVNIPKPKEINLLI